MFLPFKAIRNKKGFTLVELIVVMAVLAIISAIAVPRFLGVQEKAKLDADYATGAMIAKAGELYKAREATIPDPLTAQILIDDEYLNTINFKSEDFQKYDATTVQITFDDAGKAIVEGDDGTTTDPLYPRP